MLGSVDHGKSFITSGLGNLTNSRYGSRLFSGIATLLQNNSYTLTTLKSK